MRIEPARRYGLVLCLGASLLAAGCTTPDTGTRTTTTTTTTTTSSGVPMPSPSVMNSTGTPTAPSGTGSPMTAASGTPLTTASATPLATGSASPSSAGSASPMSAASAVPVTAPAGTIKAHGKVTAIAPDKHEFTVAHGDIPEIPMKAMTMPYKVKSPEVLDNVKPDQEVDFFIDNSTGALVVVQVVPSPR